MAPVRSEKERDIARKLRVEGGKSFPEIAAITGIDKSTVCRWAKAEGWPDPNAARRELQQILNQARKEPAESLQPPGKSQGPPGKQQQNFSFELPAGIPEVNFDADPEALGDQLFRWSMRALQNVARISIPCLIKFAEISSRVHIALHTPKPGDIRKLTVMVPAQAESYRGAPDDD